MSPRRRLKGELQYQNDWRPRRAVLANDEGDGAPIFLQDILALSESTIYSSSVYRVLRFIEIFNLKKSRNQKKKTTGKKYGKRDKIVSRS